jgi:hypothetical protein
MAMDRQGRPQGLQRSFAAVDIQEKNILKRPAGPGWAAPGRQRGSGCDHRTPKALPKSCQPNERQRTQNFPAKTRSWKPRKSRLTKKRPPKRKRTKKKSPKARQTTANAPKKAWPIFSQATESRCTNAKGEREVSWMTPPRRRKPNALQGALSTAIANKLQPPVGNNPSARRFIPRLASAGFNTRLWRRPGSWQKALPALRPAG